MAWDSLMDFQGTWTQKEGQENKGTLKQLRGYPPRSFTPPWSSWASLGLWVPWKSTKGSLGQGGRPMKAGAPS